MEYGPASRPATHRQTHREHLCFRAVRNGVDDTQAVVLRTASTTTVGRVRAYLRGTLSLRFAILVLGPPALLPLVAVALQPPPGSPLLRYMFVLAATLAAAMFGVGLLSAALVKPPQRTLVLTMDGIEERGGPSVVWHGWDWVAEARASAGLLELRVHAAPMKSLRLAAPGLTQLQIEERDVGPVIFARLLVLLQVKGMLGNADLES